MFVNTVVVGKGGSMLRQSNSFLHSVLFFPEASDGVMLIPTTTVGMASLIVCVARAIPWTSFASSVKSAKETAGAEEGAKAAAGKEANRLL
mmetsp:Transcript_1793/g.3687  ORF Transcript_1793/g.3687 Transcript_1793/m.3687 type:complete len:91 (-) Transcript_1793:140-412(-)